jgi:hypothetical protein
MRVQCTPLYAVRVGFCEYQSLTRFHFLGGMGFSPKICRPSHSSQKSIGGQKLACRRPFRRRVHCTFNLIDYSRNRDIDEDDDDG